MADGDQPLIQLDAADVLGDASEVETTDVLDTEEDTTKKESDKKESKPAPKEAVKPEDGKGLEDEKEEEDVLGPAKDENEEEKPEEGASEEETPEQQEEKQRNADTRKQQLQTEIRELVSQKNALRADVETLNKQAYRTQTAEELVNEGLSEQEAENEALRQQLEFQKYNAQVSDLSSTLGIESMQLMADFPQFDPRSPLFDEALHKTVTELYENVADVHRDPKTNLVTNVRVFPYNFYKAFAETQSSSGQRSRAEGQVEGQKAAEKNLAAAETPSSTAPKAPRVDPFRSGLLGKYKQ